MIQYDLRREKIRVLIISADRPVEESNHTFIRDEFIECPSCRAKPGSPQLCIECLERRELFSLHRRKKR